MTNTLKSTIAPSTEQRYRQLLEAFCTLANKEDVPVKPYLDANNLHFTNLAEDHQLEVYSSLDTFFKICSAAVSQGHSLFNNAVLTWEALKQLDLTPASDLFDKIQENDVIEIYDAKNVQIFRNLEFFKLCSYSFDEILCKPWFQLYKRDDEITLKLMFEAMEIFKNPGSGTRKLTIPTHFLEEVSSASLNKMNIVVKYGSPLCRDGVVKAILVTEVGEIFK